MPQRWRDAVFFEHDFRDVRRQRAETALGIASDECAYAVIRDDLYKYVHFAALPPLLFDVAGDPDEFVNLAGRPEHRDTELHYARRLLSWRLANQERVLANMHVGPGGLFERK
jgi:arylsulfatase A-like enzyme